MQVFVPYPSPIDVAKCLDSKRLHKQIIECDQIAAAISGASNAWKNHPVVKMYTPYVSWLLNYRNALYYYASGCPKLAALVSYQADEYFKPPFLTESFCDQHKRRLYTKAPELYPQFAEYGKSEENWYVVDNMVHCYVNGKLVRAVPESWLQSHNPIEDIKALNNNIMSKTENEWLPMSEHPDEGTCVEIKFRDRWNHEDHHDGVWDGKNWLMRDIYSDEYVPWPDVFELLGWCLFGRAPYAK